MVYRGLVARQKWPRAAPVTFAVALTAGCGGRATREECREILEHYIDLSLQADPELEGLPPPQAEAVRKIKRAVKLGEPSVQKVELSCEAEVERRHIRCAKSASSTEEWEACLN